MQCVILRDTEKKDAKGQAKSRGCAFVEFESHEHALVCLRQMNNNPALFGGKPARPIVEFAVENVRALKIQQKKRKAVEDMKQQRSMAERMLPMFLEPLHCLVMACSTHSSSACSCSRRGGGRAEEVQEKKAQ